MTTRRNAKIPRRSDRTDLTVENNAENIFTDEDQYVNSYVELTYDVLTIIFKNLNEKDLRNAAKVCRCWSEAANNERRVRGSLPFTLLGNLVNSWNDLSPGKPLIDHLRMKPMLSVLFTRPFDAEHPALVKNNVDCPCRILPSNCPNVTVGNPGIVKDQLESEDPCKAAFMLLPEDSGVSVETVFFPLNYKNKTYRPRGPAFRQEGDTHVTEDSLEKLRKFGTARNRVKCFVMLTSDEFPCPSFILTCMPRDHRRTLSGGVARNLTLCKNDKREKFCSTPMAWIAILISGPSVRSYSAVLRRTCNTEELIEEKLTKLKKRAQLRKHTMGFMFACEGRGEYMFHQPNVESTIFKKLFPEVPLVGCSGGGEYGDSSIDRLTNRIHLYSTVFMIVTYG